MIHDIGQHRSMLDYGGSLEVKEWIESLDSDDATRLAYYDLHLRISSELRIQGDEMLELLTTLRSLQLKSGYLKDIERLGVLYLRFRSLGTGHRAAANFFFALFHALDFGWPGFEGVLMSESDYLSGGGVRRLSELYQRFAMHEREWLDLPLGVKCRHSRVKTRPEARRPFLRSRICLYFRMYELGVPAKVAHQYVSSHIATERDWMDGRGNPRRKEFYIREVELMNLRTPQ